MDKITVLQHNIKFVREYLKMTQKKLADEIGATEDQVGTYEKRGTKPKDPIIENIAKVFGIKVNVLKTIKLNSDLYEKHFEEDLVDIPQSPLPLVEEDEEVYNNVSMKTLLKQQNKLIDSMNRQSETATEILKRMADGVELKIDGISVSLADALGRVDSLKFDLYSGRMVVLQSLARLEGKPENSLLSEADNIIASLLAQQQNTQGKKSEKRK